MINIYLLHVIIGFYLPHNLQTAREHLAYSNDTPVAADPTLIQAEMAIHFSSSAVSRTVVRNVVTYRKGFALAGGETTTFTTCA